MIVAGDEAVLHFIVFSDMLFTYVRTRISVTSGLLGAGGGGNILCPHRIAIGA